MSQRDRSTARAVARRAAHVLRPALRGAMWAAAQLERATSTAPEPPARRGPSQVEPPAPGRARGGLPTVGADTPTVAADGPRPVGLRDRLRIALFNPPRYRGITVTRLFRSEYLFVEGNHIAPMDLGYFAAAAKGRADVTIIDANAEDLTEREALGRLEEIRPDVIVLKGIVDILAHEVAVPARYKAAHPHVSLVLACRGAVHAEESIFALHPILDGIAAGEIDAFAEDLAEGVPLSRIAGMSVPGAPASTIRVVEDLDRHPWPDLDVMPPLWGRGYALPYYGIRSGYFLTASRGCPYSCTFCMVGGVDGRPFRARKRDPEGVVEELRALRRRFGVRDFYVFDEIFTSAHGQRVSEAIARAGLDVHWICEGKPDLVKRPMLEAMRRAGCKVIYYGVESGDDAILASVEKGHSVADSARALRLTRAVGIETAAYVMLGFPKESWRSYLRLVRLMMETRPDYIRYGFLAPYPITVLHRQMREAGLVGDALDSIDRRISPYRDAEIGLHTEHLSAAELRAMDLLFKATFARELTRAPAASRLG